MKEPGQLLKKIIIVFPCNIINFTIQIVSVSQLPADDSSIWCAPEVVTYGTPYAVIAYLNTSFILNRTTTKT